jgi:phage head maturation protease
MTKNQFLFPNIQVRSTVDSNKKKRVVVKGYAVAPDIPHEFARETDSSGKVLRSFKSLFTKNFVKSIAEQMRYTPIFVDALHQTAANINIRATLEGIKTKAQQLGQNFDEEVESIMSNLKVSQFPLGKPASFNIDDNGMFFEIELNPDFRDVDLDHTRYYDAVVGSLQNGTLNGMSINFQTTDVIVDEDGLERINDGKFYGISFVPDAALTSHSNITEVAIRSIMEVRNTMEIPKETKPAEPAPQPQNTKDYEKEYVKVQAELMALKAEQEKAKQQQEYSQMMENVKKEVLEAVKDDFKPKGVVKTEEPVQPQSTIKTKEEFVEKLKDLNWNELIQLQHETPNAIGNEVAQRLGLLGKNTDMDFNR